MRHDYGNPASAHHVGITADKKVAAARETLLNAIGDPEGELGDVVWTSGGTEGDALGILGAGRGNARTGKKVVISAVEHSAVRESAALLRDAGFEVVTVEVGETGAVDPQAFADACEGAAVAGLMLVNNEIGSIQPVAEATRLAKDKNPDLHVHCDAVQALGKVTIDVEALGVDTLAVAAHKLHGPKGVGALWLKNGARVSPLWGGGGHQGGLRSGTLNVPGISGFGTAIDMAMKSLSEHQHRFEMYAAQLLDAAEATGRKFRINGYGAPRAPHILSLAFQGCPAEPLLHVLESRGVMVSAGSACSERDRRPSFVLEAIGLGPDYGTIRLSFGRFTTDDDVARACTIIKDAVATF
jgi:cysteine desulfurase